MGKELDRFTTWAIDTRSDEGHGLIGRYWWFNRSAPQIPAHLEGCKTALFKTRELARAGLPSVREYSFPKAKVVKVDVIIKKSGFSLR